VELLLPISLITAQRPQSSAAQDTARYDTHIYLDSPRETERFKKLLKKLRKKSD